MIEIFATAEEAIADVPDGSTIMCGGFGLCGVPENLVRALGAKGTRNLTVISNNAGVDTFGLGGLLANGQVKKILGSYFRSSEICARLQASGALEVELLPQGTMVERIRAAGAGVFGVYLPTGVGTCVAEGKEVRLFGATECVLEYPLAADYAFIRAYQGDRLGNLVYRKTARNFNPVMAKAARITIAEVEEIVEVGELDPEVIVTPGIFVKRLVKGARYERRIE
ncbi:MAG: succinyl-CoA--3-ketoacid-CoA transferase [candidate division NC10 bacterium RIFCSPLOWO2_12_FULL_66_18]|nr:MAG: succinyl-CoA--3-ketoacid-CoA transferase [candidate division NC10 bacterium RIFCSPLOWO2_02_FULL_66_22]OGC00361.1 MAG: succinyl-CoA--3-ketoacid-CoA transferase [candidate division NC10 bacterium RIFCSPLOWO2_12_FULL_66_18]